ncbi:hypothetical protein PoB_004217200 [Plakobranchus ocellatus]|uniref:Uncharacterized protein n=1 Tax=Plakobranchus ocellatus TaxID=259542 RepID=A0AAV4B847_9GAST|nr:hypothetical protein PoB_004217200 [Plakobranchus ocellatus]
MPTHSILDNGMRQLWRFCCSHPDVSHLALGGESESLWPRSGSPLRSLAEHFSTQRRPIRRRQRGSRFSRPNAACLPARRSSLSQHEPPKRHQLHLKPACKLADGQNR